MVTTVHKITRKEADEAIRFFVEAGLYAGRIVDKKDYRKCGDKILKPDKKGVVCYLVDP